ncbi:MAG TPA: GerMN domain-containing protein [Thermoanaerobaculia bacterium]|jgi:hypothetical protein
MKPPVLAVLAVLWVLSGCSRPADPPPPRDLRAGQTIRTATVYLIPIAAHKAAGCGGATPVAAPVEVELPVPSPALAGSLAALLDAGKRYESAGFYNALADSPLKVDRIERAGGAARVYLTGYMELAGECDGPRLLEQLTRTASQFTDVKRAELFLDGKPLGDLLAGKP